MGLFQRDSLIRFARRRRGVLPRGFTLIELLVVVAILALLIAIILPSLGRAKERAKGVRCLTNVRGMTVAAITYATEWTYFPPSQVSGVVDSSGTSWTEFLNWGINNQSRVSTSMGTLSPYKGSNPNLFLCPSTPSQMLPTTAGVPTPPLDSYGLTANVSGTFSMMGGNSAQISKKITSMTRPFNTVLALETAFVSAATPGALTSITGGNVAMPSAAISAASLGQYAYGGPELMAVHTQLGSVGWGDGHGTLEKPVFDYSTTLLPNAAMRQVDMTCSFGWLTPVVADPADTTSSWSKDPRIDDYFKLNP